MNNFFRGKIEACIELSEGDAEKFKKWSIKVTSLTDQGFHQLTITDTAYQMLKRGESISATINATL